MKRYRIKENSPIWSILGILFLTSVMILSGLGNHFIDGL